jgi:hypothetical protein
MFKRRKMRFNGEWSLLAGNRVYELTNVVVMNPGQIYRHQIMKVHGKLCLNGLTKHVQSKWTTSYFEIKFVLFSNS